MNKREVYSILKKEKNVIKFDLSFMSNDERKKELIEIIKSEYKPNSSLSEIESEITEDNNFYKHPLLEYMKTPLENEIRIEKLNLRLSELDSVRDYDKECGEWMLVRMIDGGILYIERNARELKDITDEIKCEIYERVKNISISNIPVRDYIIRSILEFENKLNNKKESEIMRNEWRKEVDKQWRTCERINCENGGILSHFIIDMRDAIASKYNINIDEIEDYIESKYVNYWDVGE